MTLFMEDAYFGEFAFLLSCSASGCGRTAMRLWPAVDRAMSIQRHGSAILSRDMAGHPLAVQEDADHAGGAVHIDRLADQHVDTE